MMVNRAEVGPQREFTSYGCCILLISFTTNLLWGCVYKGVSVLLPTLRDQFTTHTWVIGIMLSAMAVSGDTVGTSTTILEKILNRRQILMSSTTMLGIGMILVSLATSVIQIFLILIIFVGPGLGISNIVSKVLTGNHFNKHYTLACGIGHTGNVVALLAIAPMTQLFLDTYGWRGAVMLIGGICLHTVACATLLRETRTRYQALPSQSDPAQCNGDRSILAFLKNNCAGFCKTMDFHLIVEYKFLVVYSCNFGFTCAYNSWVIYFVPHLQAKGISPQTAAGLCSAGAVGYFIGSLIWAPFVDRGILKCSTGLIINGLTLTLSFVVEPWLSDTLGYAVVTFIFGVAVSSMYSLHDVLIKELCGSDRLTSAYATLRLFNFLQRTISGFVPGWIYDVSGSYNLGFVVIGILPTVALLPMIVGLLQKRL